MNKYEIDNDFEDNVTLILNKIFPIQETKDSEDIKNIKTDEDFNQYIQKHKSTLLATKHKGFKESQLLIIQNLLIIQKNLHNEKKLLKEARKNKSNEQQTIKTNISILEYQENILKHLADTILWQLLQGNTHLSRRFYQNVQGTKTLEETNYQSVLIVANEINKEMSNFVLLTDITSYAQIGDLIGIVDGKYNIIEVKEGKTNATLLEDLEKVIENNNSENALQKYDKKPKEKKQLQRMIKQHEVTKDELNIIKNDIGHDPVTNKTIKIFTPTSDTIYYNKELNQLEEQLKTRNFWAYTVIDNCLHIGLYKGEKRFLGKYILKQIAKTQDIKYPIIIDARSAMQSLDCPLFFLPFSKELIMDIVMGRVIMLLMLDINNFMKLYERFGCKSTWVSRKETMKIKESLQNNTLFVCDNKSISITNIHRITMILDSGTFCKILFDHIRPMYIAYSSNMIYNSNIEPKTNKEEK